MTSNIETSCINNPPPSSTDRKQLVRTTLDFNSLFQIFYWAEFAKDKRTSLLCVSVNDEEKRLASDDTNKFCLLFFQQS
jgi:hypothetical protein